MFAFSMVASLEEAAAGAGAAAAGASVAPEAPASGAGVTTVGASAVSEVASNVAPAAAAAAVRPVLDCKKGQEVQLEVDWNVAAGLSCKLPMSEATSFKLVGHLGQEHFASSCGILIGLDPFFLLSETAPGGNDSRRPGSIHTDAPYVI